MPRQTSPSVPALPAGFQRLGSSHAYREEGALLFFHTNGVLSLEDMQAMFGLHAKIKKEFGYLLVLYDAKNGGSMSPEARKYAAEHTRPEVMHSASAIFNISYPARVIATLVHRATKVISKLPIGPMAFFATEAEARAFLENFRPKSLN